MIQKKRLLFGARWPLLLLFLVLQACGGNNAGTDSLSPHAMSVVQTARSVIGTPYSWGGASPQTGFDCSGLAYWAYNQNGIPLPRTSAEQLGLGYKVAGDVQPGDLVFFRIGQTNHVGIYAGHGIFIHSPKSGSSVREEELYKEYWMSRYLGARRFF